MSAIQAEHHAQSIYQAYLRTRYLEKEVSYRIFKEKLSLLFSLLLHRPGRDEMVV